MNEYDDLIEETEEKELTGGPELEEYAKTQEFRAKVEMVEQEMQAFPKARAAFYKGMTREQAAAYGRALGENEADRRLEEGAAREDRIARASAYAVWEWEGKPASSQAIYEEFGVKTDITPSLERTLPKRLLRGAKGT